MRFYFSAGFGNSLLIMASIYLHSASSQETTKPLIIFYRDFIIIFPDGIRLSPAPEFNEGALDVPLTPGDYIVVPRPNFPVIPTKPSREPSRGPILRPPPPPTHLIASGLLSLVEDTEPMGPPQLKPKPPRPPKIPKPSSQLLPIKPGLDELLIPEPPKFLPGLPPSPSQIASLESNGGFYISYANPLPLEYFSPLDQFEQNT